MIKEQLIMDNREVQEKFYKYKDTVRVLYLWEMLMSIKI